MNADKNSQEAKEGTSSLSSKGESTASATGDQNAPPHSHKPKRKKLWYILVAAAILVLIAGIIYAVRKSDSSNTYKGPAEKLVVGNIGEYTIFNLIAKEKGYFSKNGLDVELREYEASPQSMKDLFDKKIQIALGSENAGVNSLFSRKDLRILTQVSNQDVFQLIGRKDKGITATADLKGKRIGVTTKSIGEFFLGRFLTAHNLDLQDVTVVNLSPKEMVSQIGDGQVDAVLVFDPHAYNIKKKLGNAVVSWPATSEQRTYTLLYTLDEYTKAHPDTIKRYLKSLVMAEKLYNEDKQVGRDIGINDLHYTADFINTIWPRVDFNLGLEQELLLTMEDQARWTIKNKLTDQTEVPNYLDYIYLDGLKSVKPEAVTIID